MIRHASIVVAALSLLNPCSKPTDAAVDAAPEAAPVAAPTETAPPATVAAEPVTTNATKIGRFPNETKLGMEKEKLQADHTVARESPGSGSLVSTLLKNTEVTKIAQRNDYFLVAFPDPASPANLLGGWINKSGFSPTPPPPASCVKPQVKFEGLGCKFDCTPDGVCPAGLACTGLGTRPDVNAGAFRFCEGAAPVVVTDAGTTPPPPAVVDAGRTRATCAAGLIGTFDGRCVVRCVVQKDCAGKGTCTVIEGKLSGCL